MSKYTLEGFDNKLGKKVEYEIEGRCIAEATTHRAQHVYLMHPEGQFASRGERCPACRWFEVRIYALADDTWVVETVGQTVVPGEIVKRQVFFCDTPRRVVSCLVQSRAETPDDFFIPATSRRALDDAAEEDPRLAPLIDAVLDGDDIRSIA